MCWNSWCSSNTYVLEYLRGPSKMRMVVEVRGSRSWPCCLWIWPPAAFFPEIEMSGFFGHAHFGRKCNFGQIWSDLVYFNLEILKDWNLWTSGPFQDHGLGMLGLLDHLGQDLFLANRAGWKVRGAIAPWWNQLYFINRDNFFLCFDSILY